jgi:NTE family protein
MEKQIDQYQTAIVFQGGGALGAYEYGVIKALYEERPDFRPAVVTGISIGAINAALLVGARDDALGALDEVWRNRFTQVPSWPARALLGPLLTSEMEQRLSVFGNEGMYELRRDHLLAPCSRNSVYNLEPLRRTLREFIAVEKLNLTDGPRLVLGAVNVATGEPRYFDNRTDTLGIEHVIASGSLPPAFPPTSIENHDYWDGGLFENTPLSSAINGLEEIPGDCGREVIVVELFPSSGPVPTGMAEVRNRAGQLLFASKLKIDRKLFETIDSIIEFLQKIEPHIPDQYRNEPAYQQLFAKHKKMDALTVITAHFPQGQADAADFSRATIESRINLGYEQAKRQRIGHPQRWSEQAPFV